MPVSILSNAFSQAAAQVLHPLQEVQAGAGAALLAAADNGNPAPAPSDGVELPGGAQGLRAFGRVAHGDQPCEEDPVPGVDEIVVNPNFDPPLW